MAEKVRMMVGLSPGLRYRLKEVANLDRRAPTGDWVLKMLEEHHDNDWEVCGVSPAGPGGIWIIYRRKGT